MKKTLALVMALALVLSAASCLVSAAAAKTENVLDLGSVKTIIGATFTPDNSGLTSVEFLGSVDGTNYFRLNAEAAVAVKDGAAVLDLNMAGEKHRAFVNVRYIKVTGEPDVSGTIVPTEYETENGMDPAGPYTATGLNETGYGIAFYAAADAPEGFGLNAQDVFTSNEKAIKLNSAMITIAKKVDTGVFQIVWNDCNGWSAETGAAHINTPEGVDGVDYRDGKVYLAADQILMVTMSSGGYETANDGEYSTAKWIIRGMGIGDYFRYNDGTVEFYKVKPAAGTDIPGHETSDPGESGDPECYIWLKGDGENDPAINYKVPGSVLSDGPIVLKALVKFSDDCTGTVYVNCYSYEQDEYNNWEYLIGFIDFATAGNTAHGEWVEVAYEYDPCTGTYGDHQGNTYTPAMLSVGIGFWQAAGSISVAYMAVEQNGETVWSIDFKEGAHFDQVCEGGLFNMDDTNRGTDWDIVGSNESAGVLGDFDGDEKVTSDDAVYLLRHTLFPAQYPVTGFADFDHDSNVTSDDAVYLLRHTLFAEQYPISK